MVHFVSMPTIGQDLMEVVDSRGIKIVRHIAPEWDNLDVARIRDGKHMAVSAAHYRLPKMDPEHAHLIVDENVFGLMGDTLVVTPDTFVMVRESNAHGQEDAALERESFNPNLPQNPVEAYRNFGVRVDKKSLDKGKMANSMGNRESARRGFDAVNQMLLQHRDILMDRGVGYFDLQDLIEHRERRDTEVLSEFYRYKLGEWGIWPDQGVVLKNPYKKAKKHLHWQLIEAFRLDSRAVLDFQI